MNNENRLRKLMEKHYNNKIQFIDVLYRYHVFFLLFYNGLILRHISTLQAETFFFACQINKKIINTKVLRH